MKPTTITFDRAVSRFQNADLITVNDQIVTYLGYYDESDEKSDFILGTCNGDYRLKFNRKIKIDDSGEMVIGDYKITTYKKS